MNYCANCGKELKDGTTVCAECSTVKNSSHDLESVWAFSVFHMTLPFLFGDCTRTTIEIKNGRFYISSTDYNDNEKRLSKGIDVEKEQAELDFAKKDFEFTHSCLGVLITGLAILLTFTQWFWKVVPLFIGIFIAIAFAALFYGYILHSIIHTAVLTWKDGSKTTIFSDKREGILCFLNYLSNNGFNVKCDTLENKSDSRKD